MRHGEVENQVAGASGVLQAVEDLNVTAFLPIHGADRDIASEPCEPSEPCDTPSEPCDSCKGNDEETFVPD